MRFKVTEDVAPQFSIGKITDSEGKPLAVATAPFTDAERGKLPKKIKVILEATHTGVNRNLVEYTHDGLAASVDSWTKDYNKPVLLNHDSHSDPLGRVVSAEYKQSIIDTTKNCIQLELEITNAGAIERFLDGRYKTFSIGGYSDSAKCSICGKDQMEEGWCGHSRGRKYGDKLCYWTLGTMDYVEVSVVNCPADHNAQAISFTDENGNEIQMPGSNEGAEDSTTGKPQTDGQNPDVFGQIDSLLGIDNEPQTDGDNPSGDNGDNPEPQKDGDEPQNDGNEPGEGEQPQNDGDKPQTDSDKRIKELEALIAQKDTEIASKDEEIATLTAKVATADTATEEARSQLDSVKKQLDAANQENAGLVKQNVSLAKYAHKTMCENFADMQIALGVKQSDERESLIKDYSTYTSQKLSTSLKELMDSAPSRRTVPHVPHPGSEQIDAQSIVSESASGGNKQGEYTMDEFIDTMVGFFSGRNRHA